MMTQQNQMNLKIERLANIFYFLPDIILAFPDTDEWSVEELALLENETDSAYYIKKIYSLSSMRQYISVDAEEELIKAAETELINGFEYFKKIGQL